MPEFINETCSVWDKLARETRPLALYGMGDGAAKILSRLEECGARVAGIFASDEFVRGQSFAGFKVERYEDILRRLGQSFVVVTAFASERAEVLARFAGLAKRHDVYAPHVPLFAGDETVDAAFLARYENKLQYVYEHLADDDSRHVFAEALNYKLGGELTRLLRITTSRRSDLETLFAWNADEVYADVGAYNGDTAREFLELTHRRFRHIVALEPDPKSYGKLLKFFSEAKLPQGSFTCVNKGAWNSCGRLGFTGTGGRQAMLVTPQKLQEKISGVKPVKAKMGVDVDTLDNIMDAAGFTSTYIKVDVEGAEQQALDGMKGQLKAKPKLLLAAYHHDTDLFRLPLQLWRLQPEYRIYLRKHPYVPCWELNFFCV